MALSAEDSAILDALHKRLGLTAVSEVQRLALRALYRETFGREYADSASSQATGTAG
jgi:Arc/MetJ family transcription regulator